MNNGARHHLGSPAVLRANKEDLSSPRRHTCGPPVGHAPNANSRSRAVVCTHARGLPKQPLTSGRLLTRAWATQELLALRAVVCAGTRRPSPTAAADRRRGR